MNVTPQRLAVYRALLEAADHPGPEALWERIRPEMPSLSLATVYKTLETLVGLGLVAEVACASEVKRFDANRDPHQHLVCTRCGRIDDHRDPRLERIAPPENLHGFVPKAVEVQILGLCADCAARSTAGASDPTNEGCDLPGRARRIRPGASRAEQRQRR